MAACARPTQAPVRGLSADASFCKARPPAARTRVAVPASQPPAAAKPVAPIDAEFEEWKRARRRNLKLPWRQLSFLASVFFGVASLALPDSVNDNVQWVLYALMAASFYAGLAGRRKAKP